MRSTIASVVLALIVAACGGTQAAQPVLVDAAEAHELIGNEPELVVLDVRTPPEVAEGTLPGAVVIDLSSPTFRSQIEELDRDTTYLVYCRSGNRSQEATRLMAELGFSDIYELDGGIVAWINGGMAVTSG
jgi:phage shock protein E